MKLYLHCGDPFKPSTQGNPRGLNNVWLVLSYTLQWDSALQNLKILPSTFVKTSYALTFSLHHTQLFSLTLHHSNSFFNGIFYWSVLSWNLNETETPSFISQQQVTEPKCFNYCWRGWEKGQEVLKGSFHPNMEIQPLSSQPHNNGDSG